MAIDAVLVSEYNRIESSVVSELGAVNQVAESHGFGFPQMKTMTMMAKYDTKSL